MKGGEGLAGTEKEINEVEERIENKQRGKNGEREG